MCVSVKCAVINRRRKNKKIHQEVVSNVQVTVQPPWFCKNKGQKKPSPSRACKGHVAYVLPISSKTMSEELGAKEGRNAYFSIE